MKVSVLLPVYNSAPTVARAVESILAQDLADFELLIIDDGSTDGSRELITEYAVVDSRIRIIFHEDNAGLPQTLNEALKEARGEYAVRMDADDEAVHHRLGVQLDFMERHPSVVVAGSYVYLMGSRPEFDRLVEFPTGPEKIREILRIRNCIYHPTTIMRRAEIIRLGGYRTEFRNAEDYDLWLRARKVYDLENIPEPLLRYRVSVSGQTLARRWEQLFYIFLAQAMDSEQVGSFHEGRSHAADAISSVNRKVFFAQTEASALADLIRLRLWRDARTVAVRLLKETGSLGPAALIGAVARGVRG